jgi:hypothetical protein
MAVKEPTKGEQIADIIEEVGWAIARVILLMALIVWLIKWLFV